MEARAGIEPAMEVLQTSALPLGYRATLTNVENPRPRRGSETLERETGFEPATSTLARSHSTAELLPLCTHDYKRGFQKGAIQPVLPGLVWPCPVASRPVAELASAVISLRTSHNSLYKTCSWR